MQFLVIDLDHTLLDATAFKAALAQSLQIPENRWETVYEQYMQDYGQFNPSDFLQGVALEQRNAFAAVVKKIQMFLYPDSLDFLQRHLNAGWDITVLTYGHVEWQSEKLDRLALPKGVHTLATDQTKTQWLKVQSYRSTDRVVFIDDRGTNLEAVKAEMPAIELWWMKRSNGKYRDQIPVVYDRIVEDLAINL